MSRAWAVDMSDAYDEHLVPAVFRPYAHDLASRVASHQPRVVLEVAAGTGVLTRASWRASPGRESSRPTLTSRWSTRVPEATWRQADAMHLPFDDASFDLVACQFG